MEVPEKVFDPWETLRGSSDLKDLGGDLLSVKSLQNIKFKFWECFYSLVGTFKRTFAWGRNCKGLLSLEYVVFKKVLKSVFSLVLEEVFQSSKAFKKCIP